LIWRRNSYPSWRVAFGVAVILWLMTQLSTSVLVTLSALCLPFFPNIVGAGIARKACNRKHAGE